MTTAEILLVDDDPGAIQLMARMLAGAGHLRFATNGLAALQLARDKPPDLVLLDAEMPGMSGFEVCTALKADPLLKHSPVVFVTSHSQPEFELSGFECGAADFIAKPVSEPLMRARVQTQLRLKRLHDELTRVATVDALTGVSNRRRFDEALGREWLRGLRTGAPISLLMIDIDHFKRFNDRYGHPAGDQALRSVALALAAACRRPVDLAARFGGEEFALLLPDTARAGAARVAQRVFDGLAALAIAHADSPTAAELTVSIGIGFYDDASASWLAPSADSSFLREVDRRLSAGELLGVADLALYAAKGSGRACAYGLDIADIDAPTMAARVAGRARRMLQGGGS